MISIINYLTETDKTKLSKNEKIAAATAGAGGLGLAGYGKIKGDEIQSSKDSFINSKIFGGANLGKEAWNASAQDPDTAVYKTEAALKAAKNMQDIGVGTAALAGGALAARKLYKMYKNEIPILQRKKVVVDGSKNN